MSNITNLNRDYLIKINVKEATIDVPKMTFWNTDKKTSNMFVQLVINMSTNELISQYVTVQNATDYKITLNVIKPKTKQYKTIEATLLNEEKALFEIDLPDEYKDQVGNYNFEFEVSSKVDNNDESITTSSSTYEVKGSILTNLNQEISSSPDLPILKQLIEQVKSLQGGDLTGYQKKNDAAQKTIVEDGKLYLTKLDGTKLDDGTTLPTGSGTSIDDTNTTTDKTWSSSKIDSQFKDIVNKQKISVTDFGVKGDGSDETFLIENAIKNCSQKTLYFPTGVYGISKTLIIDNQVSLELDSNAKIIALEYMDVMIEWGKYNVYTEHCFITGGIVDGMGKAKTLLNLSWFRHFTLKDTVFLNSIEKGLVLRSHNEDIHSVEAIIDNIYFENKIVSSYNAIALIVNTTDSHISNVIVINYSTGVEVNGAGNRFYRVHPWVTHQSILNASKSFIINASNNTVTECLADSTAIGYEINKDCRILNSGYYCNRKYIPSKIQIFKYHTTNNPVLTVDNCLFDFEETVDNVEFINNECCNEKVVFTNCVYNNIKDKEQRQVSYYITKPHEANQPEYYNFAQIKIPKTNTTSTMSLYMSLIDKNYGTSSLSDSSNIEIRLQGYKNPSNVKDFSNFNVKIYCDNSKYKNKLYAKGKVDNENLIIDLFYKYNLTTWDYLVIKLDKITGNLKTYNNKLKLDWFGVQYVLGNQLFIYDNNNFVSSIESGYVTSFDFDYSKTVKELYIETDTHKASMFTDENGLVLGDWDKNPVLKIENSSKNVKVINSSWDGGHLLIGDYHIWVDENKKLRGKYGKPSNSLDGDIL